MKFLFVRPYADFSVADVANGIADALVKAGHTIEEYTLGKRLRTIGAGLTAIYGGADRVNEAELALLASEAIPYKAVAADCDWLLITCGGWVHPNALAVFRAIGGKIACVFTEGPYESTEASELRLLKVCDVAFTNERTCVPMFQEILDKEGRGGIALYLPHSYNSDVHNNKKLETRLDPDEHCDVLLVGTGYTERQRLLENVNWEGIDLKLGGLWTGIDYCGDTHRLKSHLKWPCIANSDLARLYHGCKIVLNIHRWAEMGAYSVNPRVYEVAACGTFQICDDSRGELGDLFGDSVPTYSYGVPWRLEATIRKWLANDTEREAAAKKAHKLVQEYTFANRMKTVVDTLQEFDRRRATTTTTTLLTA